MSDVPWIGVLLVQEHAQLECGHRKEQNDKCSLPFRHDDPAPTSADTLFLSLVPLLHTPPEPAKVTLVYLVRTCDAKKSRKSGEPAVKCSKYHATPFRRWSPQVRKPYLEVRDIGRLPRNRRSSLSVYDSQRNAHHRHDDFAYCVGPCKGDTAAAPNHCGVLRVLRISSGNTWGRTAKSGQPAYPYDQQAPYRVCDRRLFARSRVSFFRSAWEWPVTQWLGDASIRTRRRLLRLSLCTNL
jgi:hypothetical protein